MCETSQSQEFKWVGVLPMRIVKSNVSSVGPSSERNFSLANSLRSKLLLSLSAVHQLCSAYAAHYIY